MANGAGENSPDQKGVTAAGIVEAIEQDVELSIEQAKGAAKEAVATVKEKLGVGKPRARKPPPMKMKPRAAMAKKAAPKAIKSSKPAKASKPSSTSKGKKRAR